MLNRLTLQTTNRPISVVRHWRDTAMLELDTPYQRGHVWGTERRVNLIRSILLGVPIPSVVVNDRTTSQESEFVGDCRWKYAVIDGKQRITSILMFLDSKLEIPTEWLDPRWVESTDGDSVVFSQFSLLGRRGFEKYSMGVIEGSLRSLAEEQEVFDLINFGGLRQGEIDEDATEQKPRLMTIEETKEFIADATKRLAGPMDNVMRALLVADRKDAREHLAKLKAIRVEAVE